MSRRKSLAVQEMYKSTMRNSKFSKRCRIWKPSKPGTGLVATNEEEKGHCSGPTLHIEEIEKIFSHV